MKIAKGLRIHRSNVATQIERESPVTQAVVRGQTITVIRSRESSDLQPFDRKGTRITRLSRKSLSRLAFLVTETSVRFRSLLTLTFSRYYPKSGKTAKKLLNSILNYLRRSIKCYYVWFLEFQTRGAPHFHILLTTEATAETTEKIAAQWSKILQRNYGFGARERSKIRARHSLPEHFDNLRSEDGAKRYILCYALKPKQKTVPKNYQDVGRWWGASREVRDSIPEGVLVDITESELRSMAKANGFPEENWQVLPKIIWRKG